MALLLGKLKGWLAGAGILVLAIAAAFLGGRREGKQDARADQAREDRKARDVADEIDDAVAGRTADSNRERLKRWSPGS